MRGIAHGEAERRYRGKRLESGRQSCALMRRRVFGEMLVGRPRLVVMHRTMMIVVMMAGADQMIDFMGDIEGRAIRMQPTLHGKSMQGNKQHQENAQQPAHDR